MQSVEILIIIIGTFLSLIGTIVAFFSKKTLESITEARLELADVRLELAKLIVSHDSVDERSRVNQKEITKQKEVIEDVRRRLHTLEGGQVQILDFINNYKG